MTLSGERTLPFTVRGAERIRAEVANIREPFAAQVMQAWNATTSCANADELAEIQTLTPALVAMKEGASVKDGAWSRIELPEAAGLYQIDPRGRSEKQKGRMARSARTGTHDARLRPRTPRQRNARRHGSRSLRAPHDG